MLTKAEILEHLRAEELDRRVDHWVDLRVSQRNTRQDEYLPYSTKVRTRFDFIFSFEKIYDEEYTSFVKTEAANAVWHSLYSPLLPFLGQLKADIKYGLTAEEAAKRVQEIIDMLEDKNDRTKDC
jgi:hypothetical protein